MARRSSAVALLAVALLAAAGCSPATTPDGDRSQAGTTDPTTRAGTPHSTEGYAVPAPGPLTGRLHAPDVLLTGERELTDETVARVESVTGVEAVQRLSVASASVGGRTLQVAAVDSDGFRRFAPYATARTQSVWQRVAAGDAVLDNAVSNRLVTESGTLRLLGGVEVPVGARAPLVEGVQAVVNERRGEQLGLPAANALLVSTGIHTPSALRGALEEAVGGAATLQVLALEVDVDAEQTAVLTGTSVAAAVGSFTYTERPAGEVEPDPAWVREYIRTEEVPILGKVTCNKAVLPQLRSALAEVQRRGLAAEINPEQYAGCYYPRYIGRDRSNGLSLHSWGIAVDLNVAGNQRGTAGEMDRDVVTIFKRWGFDWGGDWRYTDPMHFEMAAVVRPGG